MEEGPLSCDSNTDQNASKIITSLIIFVEIKQKNKFPTWFCFRIARSNDYNGSLAARARHANANAMLIKAFSATEAKRRMVV